MNGKGHPKSPFTRPNNIDTHELHEEVATRQLARAYRATAITSIKNHEAQQPIGAPAASTSKMTMHKIRFCTLSLMLAMSVPLAGNDVAATSTDAGFAKPQLRVDVGGRKLNLYCSGAGKTTVVFDAPSGDGGWTWYMVQPTVARHTRACV